MSTGWVLTLSTDAALTLCCYLGEGSGGGGGGGAGGRRVDRSMPGGEAYSVVDEYHTKLMQTDLVGNNNKFYIAQVVTDVRAPLTWNVVQAQEFIRHTGWGGGLARADSIN